MVAQNNHDYNWVFRKMVLDFNDDTLEAKALDFPTDLFITNATFSNAEGAFLGYSNGCTVFDMRNDTVPGTELLNYNDFFLYDDNCIDSDFGYVNGLQGMMALYQNDTAYILHERVNFDEEGFFIFSEALLYTKLLISKDTLIQLEREVNILDDDRIGTGNLTLSLIHI